MSGYQVYKRCVIFSKIYLHMLLERRNLRPSHLFYNSLKYTWHVIRHVVESLSWVKNMYHFLLCNVYSNIQLQMTKSLWVDWKFSNDYSKLFSKVQRECMCLAFWITFFTLDKGSSYSIAGSSNWEAKLGSPRNARKVSATELDRDWRLYPPSKKNTQRPPHSSFASCFMLDASM